MRFTYLDQNALIGLGRKARKPEFRMKLDAVLASRKLNVAVSTWHLIETAHAPKLEMAVELAEFIDSLRPAWLFERHDILRMEVAEDFYSFAKVEHGTPPRLATRSAVIAALNRSPDGPRFDIPSPAFVAQWMANPEQMKLLEDAYGKNAEALMGIREHKKRGTLTEAVLRQSKQILLEHTVPRRTPTGIEIGSQTIREYIAQAQEESIPSLAIEKAISELEWDAQGHADKNSLIDKFHMISALPYVDEIVSDDGFFHSIYPATETTGYVRAKLMKNAEFMERFK